MAGETLGEEVLVHSESGMPQLDFAHYPNLIFWLVVAIVAIYFILTKVALPRIGTVLAERNDAIANDLEEAARLKRRADEASKAYDAALAAAREQSQKIAGETKAAINRELQTLLAKADAEIAAKSAESEQRLREIQEGAARSVEEVAKSAAAAIIEAFLPHAADEAALTAAIANRMKG